MFDKRHITDIFWDLDHTIWDYPTNAKLTIFELFSKYGLTEFTSHSPEKFHKSYCKHNDIAWEDYRNGKIDKLTLRKQRFSNTFKELGIEKDEFHDIFENEFVELCPTKSNLMVGSFEMLEFLNETFRQHIITNGFKETQEIKLKSSGITHFFKTITNSEDIGVQKPNTLIFQAALKSASAQAQNSVMIGDNYEADIIGAYNAGLNCIYYNQFDKSTENIPSEIVVINDLRKIGSLFG